MLTLVYGLKRQDVYGDTTQPGLHLDELLGYLRHHERLMTEQGGQRGG